MSSTATPCSSRRWPSVLMPAASPSFTRHDDSFRPGPYLPSSPFYTPQNRLARTHLGIPNRPLLPHLAAHMAGALWRWRHEHL